MHIGEFNKLIEKIKANDWNTKLDLSAKRLTLEQIKSSLKS